MLITIWARITFLNTVVLAGDSVTVLINLVVELNIKTGSNIVFDLSFSITSSPNKLKARLSSILMIGEPDILIEIYKLYSLVKTAKLVCFLRFVINASIFKTMFGRFF